MSSMLRVHGVSLPAIILVIDQYSAFREKTANAYDDLLIQLSRDGASYGIYLLISSAGFGPAEIPSRIGDNIRTVICLEMGDKFQYSEAMHISHLDVLPEAVLKAGALPFVLPVFWNFRPPCVWRPRMIIPEMRRSSASVRR